MQDDIQELCLFDDGFMIELLRLSNMISGGFMENFRIFNSDI